MSGDLTKSPTGAPRGPAQQIARIAALLGELEELSCESTRVPFPLLTQTRASLAKAVSVLKNCEQFAERAASEQDDPQPDIDGDLLERMYRILGTGRRPPER
jgi:hypothetical protein